MKLDLFLEVHCARHLSRRQSSSSSKISNNFLTFACSFLAGGITTSTGGWLLYIEIIKQKATQCPRMQVMHAARAHKSAPPKVFDFDRFTCLHRHHEERKLRSCCHVLKTLPPPLKWVRARFRGCIPTIHLSRVISSGPPSFSWCGYGRTVA